VKLCRQLVPRHHPYHLYRQGNIEYRFGSSGGFTSFSTTKPDNIDGNYQRVTIPGGATEITIRAAGNPVYSTGIILYNGNETKGIQVTDAAHHGWKTSDFNALPAISGGLPNL